MEELADGPTARSVWRRSSACVNSGCVEYAFIGNGIGIRDSKQPNSPVLTFDRDEWIAFLAGVKQGECDFPSV